MAFTHPVIIVGGSLNGLAAALLLTRYAVKPLVVERHPDTTVQYKFAGVSPRSMEIFRWTGIEQEIRDQRTGDQKGGEIVRGRNLADPDLHFMGKAWADMSAFGVTSAETCDQDVLEPILRRHAEEAGADIRFYTELTDFRQDGEGVHATIKNLETGETNAVSAPWMIAADGVGGATREKLGIGRTGPGVLQHWMNLIFETDLEPYLQGKRFTSCFVSDLNASVTPREKRWLLSLQYRPEKGERPADFDAERVRALVRRAAGRADVRADLYDAREWGVAGYIADRFKQGRVFLLGDAAHSMPPTGGFGGNTGIHDAHNLAWKLAFVLGGRADPALLESYDVERRFVGEHTLAQALARLGAWFKDPSKKIGETPPIEPDANVIFGQVYPRGALKPERAPPPGGFEDPAAPSGLAGTRAPHTMLARHGRDVAIHDLIEGKLAVLGLASEPDLRRLGGRTAEVLSLSDQPPEARAHFKRLYQIDAEDAVITRPDGMIAWRGSDAADAEEARKSLHLKEGARG